MKPKNNALFGFLSVILLWYLIYFGNRGGCVPSPHETVWRLLTTFNEDQLMLHIGYSLFRIVVSVTLAVFVGVVGGVTLGLSKKADYFISPGIYILFPVPKAALLPVIFAIFGLGECSKIFLIFLIVVFQVIISVRDSVKGLPEEVFISAKALGMTQRDVLKHIVLPGIVPSLLSSTRVSIGIGLAVLFFSEAYATEFGIGYYIINKWSMIEYKSMYGGIVVLSLIGYGLFRLLDLCEEKYCKWSRL